MRSFVPVDDKRNTGHGEFYLPYLILKHRFTTIIVGIIGLGRKFCATNDQARSSHPKHSAMSGMNSQL